MCKALQRGVAFSLSIVLLCTHTLFAHMPEVSLWKERQKALQNSPRPSFSPRIVEKPTTHSDPILNLSRFGVIRSVQKSPNPHAATVVVIQDVHGRLEAQKNTGAMILSLTEKFPDVLVGLEGAAEKISFDRYRTSTPEVNKEAGSFFLNTGIITGAEYAGFASKEKPNFIGIENAELYVKNVAAVRSALAAQKQNLSNIETRKTELDQAKQASFSPALLELDRLRSGYNQGTVGLNEYLAALAKHRQPTSKTLRLFIETAALEKNLDFDRAERERNQFLSNLAEKLSSDELQRLKEETKALQSKEISYPGYFRNLETLSIKSRISLNKTPEFKRYLSYVLQSDSIQADDLLTQLPLFEQTVWNTLCSTKEAAEFNKRTVQLTLEEKCARLTLTPTEWDAAKEFSTPTHDFYRLAEARNKALADNFLSAFRGQMGVIVVGGFHSRGIAELLTQKGFSVVTVSPKLTNIDKRLDNEYLNVFTREKTPLEKLFESPKISIVQTLAVAPIDNENSNANALNKLVQPLLKTVEKVIVYERPAIEDEDGDVTVVAALPDQPNPLEGQREDFVLTGKTDSGIRIWVYGKDHPWGKMGAAVQTRKQILNAAKKEWWFPLVHLIPASLVIFSASHSQASKFTQLFSGMATGLVVVAVSVFILQPWLHRKTHNRNGIQKIKEWFMGVGFISTAALTFLYSSLNMFSAWKNPVPLFCGALLFFSTIIIGTVYILFLQKNNQMASRDPSIPPLSIGFGKLGASAKPIGLEQWNWALVSSPIFAAGLLTVVFKLNPIWGYVVLIPALILGFKILFSQLRRQRFVRSHDRIILSNPRLFAQPLARTSDPEFERQLTKAMKDVNKNKADLDLFLRTFVIPEIIEQSDKREWLEGALWALASDPKILEKMFFYFRWTNASGYLNDQSNLLIALLRAMGHFKDVDARVSRLLKKLAGLNDHEVGQAAAMIQIEKFLSEKYLRMDKVESYRKYLDKKDLRFGYFTIAAAVAFQMLAMMLAEYTVQPEWLAVVAYAIAQFIGMAVHASNNKHDLWEGVLGASAAETTRGPVIDLNVLEALSETDPRGGYVVDLKEVNDYLTGQGNPLSNRKKTRLIKQIHGIEQTVFLISNSYDHWKRYVDFIFSSQLHDKTIFVFFDETGRVQGFAKVSLEISNSLQTIAAIKSNNRQMIGTRLMDAYFNYLKKNGRREAKWDALNESIGFYDFYLRLHATPAVKQGSMYTTYKVLVKNWAPLPTGFVLTPLQKNLIQSGFDFNESKQLMQQTETPFYADEEEAEIGSHTVNAFHIDALMGTRPLIEPSGRETHAHLMKRIETFKPNMHQRPDILIVRSSGRNALAVTGAQAKVFARLRRLAMAPGNKAAKNIEMYLKRVTIVVENMGIIYPSKVLEHAHIEIENNVRLNLYTASPQEIDLSDSWADFIVHVLAEGLKVIPISTRLKGARAAKMAA